MGRYIERSDIENWFGVKNVKTYADKDNDGDTVKIDAQIDRAIATAEDEVDSRFRGYRYQIPFPGGAATPNEVKDWASRKAGVWLYQGRGLRDTDTDSRMDDHLDDVDSAMTAHIAGQRRLDAPLVDRLPNAPVAL